MPASAEDPGGDFASFADWVWNQAAMCLTFARGLSREQMLEGFGLGPGRAAEETLREADEAAHLARLTSSAGLGRPRVRVGERDGWGYAVEHLTNRGSEERTLRRLSAMGGEAFALSFTQKIITFWYAAAGERVCGFDLTVPHVRWGPHPHRFDAEMERAGFLRPDPADPVATGARFVQLAFGITIDREMLERPLLSVELT